MDEAVARQRQIKVGSSAKKLALIEAMNPDWADPYGCSRDLQRVARHEKRAAMPGLQTAAVWGCPCGNVGAKI
jgi:hypothetical protein